MKIIELINLKCGEQTGMRNNNIFKWFNWQKNKGMTNDEVLGKLMNTLDESELN